MRNLYQYLVGFYAHHEQVRPPTFHYGKTITTLNHSYLKELDHCFYTNPMPIVNFEDFHFPSTCVGFESVGRSLQQIYANSSTARSLYDDNGLYLHPE